MTGVAAEASRVAALEAAPSLRPNLLRPWP
jgi:hypothetical protein